MEYLLTYIDKATRWPEAIPIRKATTGIITSKLTDIFSRIGFPGVVVTDNVHNSLANSLRDIAWTMELSQ